MNAVIYVLRDTNDRVTTEIVLRAFQRSFSCGQVRVVDDCLDIPARSGIVVAISPGEAAASRLGRLASSGGKVILFGSLPAAVADIAGTDIVAVDPSLVPTAACEAAPTGATRSSVAALQYSDTILGRASPLRRRYFCRFDFTNEWNNLGYGRLGFA